MPRLSEEEYEEMNRGPEVEVSDAEYMQFRSKKIAQASTPEEVARVTKEYPHPDQIAAAEAAAPSAERPPDYSDEAEKVIDEAFHMGKEAWEQAMWHYGRMSRRPQGVWDPDPRESE